MSKLHDSIIDSLHELKSVRTITVCAMFGAISIILSHVASITIMPGLKVGFGALPNELVDYMFGPVVGSLFGGSMDVLKYILKPDGGFIPGLTLNAMLAAFIYGLLLYKHKVSLWRMLAAKLIVVVFINAMLGTYWLLPVIGKGFMALFPARLTKNLIQWPIDSLIFYIVAKALEKPLRQVMGKP